MNAKTISISTDRFSEIKKINFKTTFLIKSEYYFYIHVLNISQNFHNNGHSMTGVFYWSHIHKLAWIRQICLLLLI